MAKSKWYCAVSGSSANSPRPSAYGLIDGPYDTLEEAKSQHHERFDAFGEEVVTYFRGEIEEILV